MPIEVLMEAPMEVPMEAPIEVPMEVPMEAPMEVPMEVHLWKCAYESIPKIRCKTVNSCKCDPIQMLGK